MKEKDLNELQEENSEKEIKKNRPKYKELYEEAIKEIEELKNPDIKPDSSRFLRNLHVPSYIVNEDVFKRVKKLSAKAMMDISVSEILEQMVNDIYIIFETIRPETYAEKNHELNKNINKLNSLTEGWKTIHNEIYTNSSLVELGKLINIIRNNNNGE